MTLDSLWVGPRHQSLLCLGDSNVQPHWGVKCHSIHFTPWVFLPCVPLDDICEGSCQCQTLARSSHCDANLHLLGHIIGEANTYKKALCPWRTTLPHWVDTPHWTSTFLFWQVNCVFEFLWLLLWNLCRTVFKRHSKIKCMDLKHFPNYLSSFHFCFFLS